MKADEKIILALDFSSEKDALNLLDQLPSISFVKVGLQLFYSAGPSIINKIKERKIKLFLDLKLHDIPQTVASALQSLEIFQAEFITIHLSGGEVMIKEALKINPNIIGVTLLTSIDQSNLHCELKVNLDLNHYVDHLALMAQKCGMKGIVCSPHEVTKIKTFWPNSIIITPGVRLNSQNNDQKRVMTPKKCLEAGSNYLVIGREITQDKNPKLALAKIREHLYGI